MNEITICDNSYVTERFFNDNFEFIYDNGKNIDEYSSNSTKTKSSPALLAN